ATPPDRRTSVGNWARGGPRPFDHRQCVLIAQGEHGVVIDVDIGLYQPPDRGVDPARHAADQPGHAGAVAAVVDIGSRTVALAVVEPAVEVGRAAIFLWSTMAATEA